MKCPDCLQRIHGSAAECPHCGMTLATLRVSYEGMPARVEAGVYDEAGVLRSGMVKRVEAAVKRCGRQFENLSIAVAYVALGDGMTLEQFGFWLLNYGEFYDGGKCQTENSGRVLVMMDVKGKRAGIAYGYLLDGFIREGESFEVLASGHADLLEGDYVVGTERVMISLRRYLRRVYSRAQRASKKRKRRLT